MQAWTTVADLNICILEEYLSNGIIVTYSCSLYSSNAILLGLAELTHTEHRTRHENTKTQSITHSLASTSFHRTAIEHMSFNYTSHSDSQNSSPLRRGEGTSGRSFTDSYQGTITPKVGPT